MTFYWMNVLEFNKVSLKGDLKISWDYKYFLIIRIIIVFKIRKLPLRRMIDITLF